MKSSLLEKVRIYGSLVTQITDLSLQPGREGYEKRTIQGRIFFYDVVTDSYDPKYQKGFYEQLDELYLQTQRELEKGNIEKKKSDVLLVKVLSYLNRIFGEKYMDKEALIFIREFERSI